MRVNASNLVPGASATIIDRSDKLYLDKNFTVNAMHGDLVTYPRVLDNLASDAIIAPASMMPMHNRQFINKMYSCDLGNGQAEHKDNTCLWVDGRYNESSMDRNAEDFGHRMRSSIIQLGGEYQFNDNWSAGASIGFDHLNVNAKGIDLHTKGNTVVGGVFIPAWEPGLTPAKLQSTPV